MERGEKSEKILEYLRDGIRSGTWDNSLLPKETELASQFGVARGTVRHALEHLVSEGVIGCIQVRRQAEVHRRF